MLSSYQFLNCFNVNSWIHLDFTVIQSLLICTMVLLINYLDLFAEDETRGPRLSQSACFVNV